MRALSIAPEYVDEIYLGKKNIEYRTWYTPHRGDLLICATQWRDMQGHKYHGHAAYVVTLADVVKADGVYEWWLEGLRKIRPFMVKGKQRLFDVDDDLIEYIDNLTDDEINSIYQDFVESSKIK
jgi:hypothetical protein